MQASEPGSLDVRSSHGATRYIEYHMHYAELKHDGSFIHIVGASGVKVGVWVKAAQMVNPVHPGHAPATETLHGYSLEQQLRGGTSRSHPPLVRNRGLHHHPLRVHPPILRPLYLRIVRGADHACGSSGRMYLYPPTERKSKRGVSDGESMAYACAGLEGVAGGRDRDGEYYWVGE
ncbi:uncharacterized protein CC84DRAFT_1179054 [Paraphaeosphaeria sporulosa]|uniref:Uncharacterized protein n=1 Tax=Paraphaeosphaeria sporulosa TaxID=1460663 RepID=A0A177C3A6_9PLEO|nr:uncharacterized protein CC84DRAFT_1179054 [Paraphaeosphaeria sporulosa]OAG02103.1 hypothetical protein CC84DRAFT_1179054 [Paraphaeosphaeria sporulosa]